ncbi:unnamed protein product [Protopolystoma xenopodis]|uniref:Uncharacterized protein n=1 Tax=Protopolystoma xenopodis TaxID=117903 RepID=A0A3S5AL14_9PLAT|nr:unnamed protein product [Protopolystoma xenopodis]
MRDACEQACAVLGAAKAAHFAATRGTSVGDTEEDMAEAFASLFDRVLGRNEEDKREEQDQVPEKEPLPQNMKEPAGKACFLIVSMTSTLRP